MMPEPKSSQDIASYFTLQGCKPRDVQLEVFRQLQEKWDKADVFIVNLPVATGKSAIATTLALWAHHRQKMKSAIITPTNILVDQYKKDFPWFPTMERMSNYVCSRGVSIEKPNCDEFSMFMKKPSNRRTFCPDCTYKKALQKSFWTPYILANYYIYLSYGSLRRDVLIVDEAHNLIPVIQDRLGFKLWQRDYNWPDYIRTYGDIKRWLESNPQLKKKRKLSKLLKSFDSKNPEYVLERTTEELYGIPRPLLKAYPVDISKAPPIFWNKAKKTILMSATIGKKDLEQLNLLSGRRVAYISADSPIVSMRRPVIYQPVCNMSYWNQNNTDSLEQAAAYILDILEKRKEKGIIHLPYSTKERLKSLLDHPRLIWHGKDDKAKAYEEFANSPSEEGKVLMASGLYEGIDLPYDQGRWQIIAKVPWGSLGDPAIRYKVEQDSDWYTWETLKTMMQAFGRICRKLDDYGETYIIDSSFKRLYSAGKNMIPLWLKDSIHGVEDE